ncbi:GNAT family N-acetyltransferase [Duganella ginsengisoli]|uniref:GNAT family N-acetyltransferase n=2 Tax=Pseudoduganella ginsengisoli TaxID=1462440 RepID=A0A6L6Q7Q0_9BURK|nr:GNAT family N-acetyltransferase [Pseudoduganella ginsengisoli]
MTKAQLGMVLDWAAAEGWNPGLHDADSFYAADPGGYLLALVDGVPAASIFAVRYGERFGFIGGYIALPRFRGQGHGMAIWNAGMAQLAGRTVGLDGVPAQQGNYAKSGFVLAHRNVRFEGTGRGMAGDSGGPGMHGAHGGVVPLASVSATEVVRYDRPFFAGDRSIFVQHWITQPGSVALGIAAAGRLAGYAVLRPCRTGYKVGPLFADTPAQAHALFDALLLHVPAGSPIYLDVPEPNREAMALARSYGMQPCFETARMYTGAAPVLDLARTYGITTFELG